MNSRTLLPRSSWLLAAVPGQHFNEGHDHYISHRPQSLSSSSSIGTTTLIWVSTCSTVVEHSQQEGFTECRYRRHVKTPTWRRTGDLERSNFRHKRPPASEATLANLVAEGGIMCEKFCRKWRLPRHFWVLLHAVKHDMGQTALLPLRRKAC
jgi:hypothetical protein